MSTLTAVVSSRSSARPNLLLDLYTKNPFYAISAALVFWGLCVSFGDAAKASETWLLMGGLTSYTLLLAATVYVLVRWLGLWDDTRTVLLLVVLMFLAISVTFDHVLVNQPSNGTIIYLLGYVLAVAVSEALLRGIRLKLRPLLRVPYYVVLAVFFLYPLFIRLWLDLGNPLRPELLWALFGFSTAAGLAFLTLLPAIREGQAYVRDNGSPWPWPYYPWSLYVILALAVPGRAVLSCWSLQSLHTGQFDRLVFGPYFLVPFCFALTILALEFGLVEGRRPIQWLALGLPWCWVGLALLGHSIDDPIYRTLRLMTTSIGKFRAFDAVRVEPDPIYNEFLRVFSARLGADPLFYSVLLAACFYAYAAYRRVPLAMEGLALALGAFAVVPVNALAMGLLFPPEPGPLLLPAALLVVYGWRRAGWHFPTGAALAAAALCLAVPLPEDATPALRLVLFLHLVLVASLWAGAVRNDGVGLVLRHVAAGLTLVLAFAAMVLADRVPADVAVWIPLYALVLGGTVAIFGSRLRHAASLFVATAIIGVWVFLYGWRGYRTIRNLLKGFDYIVGGLGFFAVGAFVSLAKAGMLQRWFGDRWWYRQASLAWRPTPLPVNAPAVAQTGAPEVPLETEPTGGV